MVTGALAAMARLVLKPRRARHVATTLAAALVAGGVVFAALAYTPPGERLEARTIDGRFERRGPLPVARDVVVVGIDEKTATTFNSWPLSRALYAQVIRNLAAAGAAAIVLDVPFDDAIPGGTRAGRAEAIARIPAWQRAGVTGGGETEDDMFAREAAAAGNVVVAVRAAGDRRAGRLATPLAGMETTDHPDPVAESGVAVGVSDRAAGWGEAGVVRHHRARARWSGGGRALAGAANEREADGDTVPSAALAALRVAAAGGDGDGADGTGGGRAGAGGFPNSITLNWPGGPSRFEQVSFGDVALGISVGRSFAGKVVIVGRTDGVSRDEVRTPFGTQPAVMAQATAYSNLASGAWLRDAPRWAAAAGTLALVLVAWALLESVALALAVPGAIAAGAGWVWLAERAFARGVAVPVAAPVAALAAAAFAVVLVLVVDSVRERLRIKGLFARYVAPDVVRDLIDADDTIRLGGEQREITVMFVDIRGFTTLSEQLDPAEMVEQLNAYFAEMVDVVTAHRGTIDKFLGDGLMAIFGAPADQHDHAELACRTALEMLDRLEQVNARRTAAGQPALAIGIGIHTGRAVVGNIGSPLFRVDFTAIGDTVNLASRLEGMTKELGVTVLASGDTVAAVRGAGASAGTTTGDGEAAGGSPEGIGFDPRGTVVVRGRTAATEVFAVGRGASVQQLGDSPS